MIVLIALIVCLIILSYGVLYTIIVRVFSYRMLKKGKMNAEIALTFDDGPDPIYTEQLLDLLKEYDAKATFFVVGERAQRYPVLLQRMIKEGHSIGIHHYHHSNSWFLTPWKLRQEIEQCAKVITEATGKKPVYYRPPFGRFNMTSMHVAKEYHIVMWSSIHQDWKVSQGKERLYASLSNDLAPGTIYLLHDNGDNPGADQEAPAVMLEALRPFLAHATEQGYRCTSLATFSQNK
ncbi:polysaccharide deacetylase [Fictibacillus macauensis ZFHKF-1]|uniref:Polysaccharide deacetylase n=1 Tax=Fictibacillus macauensis ZFHKF-1 TaxID=1196324 RepID=I8J2M4_9BACL|nr:polysaccharide deacetylase family protein [Fictibacillus macauensis]EIT85986.1 polysaccharide deacetylase [Fictibacillus macauensis ZFHKF-1]